MKHKKAHEVDLRGFCFLKIIGTVLINRIGVERELYMQQHRQSANGALTESNKGGRKMYKKTKAWLMASLLAVFVAGCGGGGGGSSESPAVTQTGVFVDSAVEGIKYQTATQSGLTNSAGEFKYIAGETVTFSIGDINLPAAMASSVMTPLTLVGTSSSTDTAVVNIARLLQTLDVDGDPANGISINAAAHTAASGMTVSFDSATFDNDVNTLVVNSNTVSTTLVSPETAVAHLQGTLETVAPDQFSMEWLSGKTLYEVWFGSIDDSTEDVGRVVKVVFGADGNLTYTNLLNDSSSGSTTYGVNAAGSLYFNGVTTEVNTIVSGSTADYIRTNYVDNGSVDNVDLFFFDEAKALAYASTLTASIPLDGEAPPSFDGNYTAYSHTSDGFTHEASITITGNIMTGSHTISKDDGTYTLKSFLAGTVTRYPDYPIKASITGSVWCNVPGPTEGEVIEVKYPITGAIDVNEDGSAGLWWSVQGSCRCAPGGMPQRQ